MAIAHGASRRRQPEGGDHGLRRIVVGTDLSSAARPAFDRALELPLRPGAMITLVHVFPERLRGRAEQLARAGAASILERQVRLARAELDRRLRADIRVRTKVTRGRVHEALLRVARTARAEVLVIGRYGRSRAGSDGLGSVASRLVRTSPIPLLIVARAALRPYQNPVAAADLSASCRRVLKVLGLLLEPEVARRVTVFHVDDSPFEDALVLGGASLRELRRFRREHSMRMAQALKGVIAGIAPVGARWRLIQRPGEPRREVLEFARSSGADLLALGTHGRSGLSRALLGSVAETVIRAAGVDVLVAATRG